MNEVRRALDSSSCGIIIITPENQDRPWLHFEAGSLLARFDYEKTRVIPVLVDFLSVTELRASPLTNLQVSLLDDEGWRRIITSLSNALKVDPSVRLRTAIAMWPELADQVEDINERYRALASNHVKRRSSEDKIDEILEMTRLLRNMSIHGKTPPMRGFEGEIIDTTDDRMILMGDDGVAISLNRTRPGAPPHYLEPDDPWIPVDIVQRIKRWSRKSGILWQHPPQSTGAQLYLMKEAPDSPTEAVLESDDA